MTGLSVMLYARWSPRSRYETAVNLGEEPPPRLGGYSPSRRPRSL